MTTDSDHHSQMIAAAKWPLKQSNEPTPSLDGKGDSYCE